MSEPAPQHESSIADRPATEAGGAPPSGAVPSFRADDPERRALADRISEDVMQLLYTARQDLAELSTQTTADPRLVRSAHDCTAGAISILRGVVATVLTAAWGPPPTPGATDTDWDRSAAVLFDALSDAWVITCEDDDLLYASHAACEVLGRSAEELTSLMRQSDGWPKRLAQAPRDAAATDPVEFVIDVPVRNGEVRRIDVVSHPLPAAPDLEPSYISLLKERDDRDAGPAA
jgi:PAS domain-containing protein